ncbi:hypothetical protein [Bordetella bronchiseptica]|uniref:hypothetical protein n=1 Tax=Bordetella bronchiseptica TaxID=518 RepID=UPI0009B87DAD|nr:hypothetical protein [Bordetella bronchiseptica]
MTKRQVGFMVVGNAVTVIDAEVPVDVATPITVLSDTTWTLQQGERGPALNVLHQRCAGYLKENNVSAVVIKASAVPQGAARLALLESAEVRGVVIAAAASICEVKTVSKAVISRTFGDRKVDDYLTDDDFWTKETVGLKRKTSREAALLLIANRK